MESFCQPRPATPAVLPFNLLCHPAHLPEGQQKNQKISQRYSGIVYQHLKLAPAISTSLTTNPKHSLMQGTTKKFNSIPMKPVNNPSSPNVLLRTADNPRELNLVPSFTNLCLLLGKP